MLTPRHRAIKVQQSSDRFRSGEQDEVVSAKGETFISQFPSGNLDKESRGETLKADRAKTDDGRIDCADFTSSRDCQRSSGRQRHCQG